MALSDTYHFDLLKNEAEELVLQELETQLENYGPELCRCNECIVDMAAVALNSIKPLYRFSLLGSLYAAQALTEQSYTESVQNAVAEAIDKVNSNPGHD